MFRRIFSDQLTPVLAYKCLVRGDDKEAPSFLLESVEDGIRAVRTCCHRPGFSDLFRSFPLVFFCASQKEDPMHPAGSMVKLRLCGMCRIPLLLLFDAVMNSASN
jgi:hypothetical protein